nr:N-methyl-L-tryptophan oxidase [Dactylosporangium thailandense]
MKSARVAGRVVVVGAGVAGLAAAWSARCLGFAVTCLEAREIGHPQGSSAGPAKIFRYAYEDETFARLLMDTEERWRELERLTATALIRPCPGLNIGRADSAALAAITGSLEAAGRKYEVLLPGDARLAEFGLRLFAGEAAVLELDAGVMEPPVVLRALAGHLRAGGAELRERVVARRIEPRGDGLVVRTDAGDVAADRVVVAAGPWLADLVERPPVPLTVTRQHQLSFATDRPIGAGTPFSWAEITTDDGYGISNLHGAHIIGNHLPGPAGRHSGNAGDPHELDAVHARLGAFRRRLTDAPGVAVTAARTCHYTSAPGDAFLISRHPDLPGTVLLSACSGHGFKFALTTGRRAVELAAEA